MKSSTIAKGVAACAASTALVVGSAGAAAAQGNVIPGDDYDGRTVLVNQGDTEFEIVSVDRDTGVVSLRMVNRTGSQLRCETANPDERNRPSSTVSTAETIAAAEHFYSRYQLRAAEELGGAFTLGITVNVALWPFLQFLPSGSTAGLLSDRMIAQDAVYTGHREAKQDGLAGTAGGFDIGNNQERPWTINLNLPAQSPRSEDPIGAIVMCGPGGTQGNQQLYAWTAYEEGWPPPEEPGAEPGPGSLEAGSLGSVMDGSGSAGSTGDADLTTGSFGSATDVEGNPDDAAGSAGSANGS